MICLRFDGGSEDRPVGAHRRDLVARLLPARPRALEADGYTVYLHPRSFLPQGGEGALIFGRLGIRQGCVVLEWPEEGQWYPVVWPGGTSIASTDPLAVRLPSGDALAIGELVMGAGGYHKAATLQLEIPAECLNEWQEVAVFNPDDKPPKD